MDLTGQWADTLLALERLFYLKIIVWGALCTLGGSSVITWLLVSRTESRLLRRFANITLASGVLAVAAGFWMRHAAGLRDLTAAIWLDRWLWFGVGFATGVVLAGLTLAFLATRASAERRPGMVGAGIAVIVQGLAFALLSLQLSAGVVR